MRRRWNQLSSSDDDHWTVGTWGLFLVLFAFFGGLLWCITGWGPGWLSASGSFFSAAFQSMGRGRLHGDSSFFCLCLGVIVFATPISITLIPTLSVLLWIMGRAKRLQAGRNANEQDREDEIE
ncbi:MAG: hypothetical protein ABFC96_11415 [Thermoguttaceae bacterium]